MTGASRGIGRAVAGELASDGLRLVLTGRDPERLSGAADATGGHALPADLADAEQVERLIAETRAALGGTPDLLVNAAGLFDLRPAATTPPERFEELVAVNLVAPFRLVRAFLPAMLERGAGCLVHLGSPAGRQPYPGNAAYGASKYGLRGLHEVLEVELEGTGVRSLLVEPGPVDTAAWDPFEKRLGRDLPPRSGMLRPEEVARVLVEAVRGERETDGALVLTAPGRG